MSRPVRVRKVTGAVHAEVDGELVVLNPHTEEFVTFNDVARDVWLAIGDQTVCVAEVAGCVVAEYDVDADLGTARITDFIGEAVRVGLLETVD